MKDYLENDDYLLEDRYKIRFFINTPGDSFRRAFLTDAGTPAKTSCQEKDFDRALAAVLGQEAKNSADRRIRFEQVSSRLEMSNYIYQHYCAILDLKEELLGTGEVPLYKIHEGAAYSENARRIYQASIKGSLSDIFSRTLVERFVGDKKTGRKLIDALQRWGRKKYNNHSIHWKPLFSNDQYDIQVVKKQLVITILSYSKDYTRIKRQILDDLNSYLDGCASHVSLEIREDI